MQELEPLTDMDEKTGKNVQTVNYIHLSQRDMERFKQNPYFEAGQMEKIKKGVITIIREAKSKGEKERYNHLNEELQRRARRNKKAFLSDQCKEIEENNRKGKTRDLFKKIRDTKGIFHAKMGTIKDRNGMDLIEAEDIKKRWQEYTGELYKKELHDPDNHNGVIIHLEPDILECEVKWALESITTNKASGGDGIPVELFQILKDDAMKVLHSICQKIWKTQQWPQDWKRSVFIPIPKGMPKNAQTTTQLHSSHKLVK